MACKHLDSRISYNSFLNQYSRCGSAVVIHLLPSSEIGVQIPAQTQVGKLVCVAVGHHFSVQNLDQLYVLVSFTLLITFYNITDITVIGMM